MTTLSTILARIEAAIEEASKGPISPFVAKVQVSDLRYLVEELRRLKTVADSEA